MPRVSIDGREIEVSPGTSILAAARELGIDIPTLCHLEGCAVQTTCMVCLVKLQPSGRAVPSCATLVQDGMRIDSETPEVRALRRTSLELLLSHHLGDCAAPCESASPAHLDIPLMLRQVADGRLRDAIATIRREMALPATLASISADGGEKACRRGLIDAPVGINAILRFVAESDLASNDPYVPACGQQTGKKVAIVGAGAAGLTAAYHLLRMGHACTLFEKHSMPGGLLRDALDAACLPHDFLGAEVAIIARMGAAMVMDTMIGTPQKLDELRARSDAVLVAIGSIADGTADPLGLPSVRDRLKVDLTTHETGLPGVFATGEVIRPGKVLARSAADGKAAALCIDQYLSGRTVSGTERAVNVRMGKLTETEVSLLVTQVSSSASPEPGGSGRRLTLDEARAGARRCLQCDCGKKDGCKLREYADRLGADPGRYKAERRRLERVVQQGGVVFEPGKCILCGLCVDIATRVREPLGLTFIGRGFDVRVGVPFDRTLSEALQRVAARCAEACPTGALAIRPELCGDGTCDRCRSRGG
ncbi:MAG TPA: FAD-dependent oxidoreductase [Phycisphaerae bacterium]|nr:FAD-dependent oxidoreductase [Phycisphaerae bacterium]HRY70600.1 FAD-dependent oxidoreductase [Phycisphaerae bacterium]HSA28350.1 FAD-dependent oxidoreductase [Phycisphaerae bacterium]